MPLEALFRIPTSFTVSHEVYKRLLDGDCLYDLLSGFLARHMLIVPCRLAISPVAAHEFETIIAC